MPYFVYILRADDGRFYVGQTNNLETRLKQHQRGAVQTTKRRTGWTIVHTEEFDARIDAIQRERAIKRKKSRVYIERLIAQSAS